MMMTDKNVEKLQVALDFITSNPRNWEQGKWIERPSGDPIKIEPSEAAQCGTIGCVAGWLVMLNNGVPADAWVKTEVYDWGRGKWVAGFEPDLGMFDVPGVAMDLLSEADADNSRLRQILYRMFDGGRSLGQIWFLAQMAAEGRLRVPAEVELDDPDAGFEPCDCGYCGL